MTHSASNTLARLASIFLTSAAAVTLAPAAQAADQLLSGAVTSASGEKLGGVTVSAKLEGSTITTSVYSDETGNYYFPPLAAGKYKVWAQALGFETAKGEVDLSAAKQQNLVLKAMTDQEQIIRQMPGEMLVEALPDETEADARIDGRISSGGIRRRRTHQENFHEPVHRLPYAELHPAAQVR